MSEIYRIVIYFTSFVFVLYFKMIILVGLRKIVNIHEIYFKRNLDNIITL